MNYNNLIISASEAGTILSEVYGLNGEISNLPGEVDFNFRVKIENVEGYILKISRPNEDEGYLDFQQKLLQFIASRNQKIIAPKVILDKNGKAISEITDSYGKERKVRLLTWVTGRIWHTVNPQLEDLRFSLGEQCGILTKSLEGFEHPKAHREFIWDIAQSLWTIKHINLFNKEENDIISFFQSKFENQQSEYTILRKSIVHNDANDYNVIVSKDLLNPKVKAAIDYGDAIRTQIINDVAITTAYGIMNHEDPLNASIDIIKGYHKTFPLLEEELPHLFASIAMRLIITVTRSAINKQKEPDNEYLLISEKPAWDVLRKWILISSDFAHYTFREACDFMPHPNQVKFIDWSKNNGFKFSNLFPSINKETIQPIDLSVESLWLGHEVDFNDLDLFSYKIKTLQTENKNKIIAGGYLEARSVYSTSSYDKIGNYGKESRTVHLGIDFWLPAETPVNSILDGEIILAINDAGDKEYGGLIILKHRTDEFDFYTLYGHLSVESILKHSVGDKIIKDDEIAKLGNHLENGNWVPHFHFQVMLSMLNFEVDFPGVCYHSQKEVWKSICPDPNLLFKSDDLKRRQYISNEELIDFRQEHLGKSLSLQYKTPIKMVRGSYQYLIDQNGKKYLDTVNNVAHVGHENIKIVRAGQKQMSLINTNSRYLHKNINDLAKELIETFPKELNVIHFVNSGSEANELAIRMVKAFTGQKDIIASEMGYHGNSNMCIDISSYKFDSRGGNGAPEYTHIFPLPDSFRGKYIGKDSKDKYVAEVQKQIDVIHNKKRKVGAFIIEPIISCGGQIELPNGFLPSVYKLVREAGGLCISDEVQTGCGRMGKSFWGFQLHNVVPNIVTIGKPLGNGHPIAAVVCTQEVADKFANGMKYFNTFGGNPVSCAIGEAVIKTVKEDGLQKNALVVGEFLKKELLELSKEFLIIGDVRGQGLFLGIEFVDSAMNPLANQANYMVNRIKDFGILMSTDGPDQNVLKIKPPIVFTKKNAVELLFYIRKILNEDFMKSF